MAKNKVLESEEKTIITFLLSVEGKNVVHQLAKSCILQKKKKQNHNLCFQYMQQQQQKWKTG